MRCFLIYSKNFPKFFFLKIYQKTSHFSFCTKKNFMVEIEGDSKGLENIYSTEGLESPGSPGGTWEGINNLWPVGTEDLYSVIFSL